jgi:protein-disulfide isomerase
MRRIICLASFLAVSLCAVAAEPSDGVRSSSNDNVLVEVNGVKITLADFERKHPTALFQAQNSYYETQKKAVDVFVDEYLLEEQAKKENITVAQLLERHVTSQIAKDPTDEALRIYYEGVDTNEPYEAVKGKIIEALRQRRTLKLRAAYFQSLRAKATIAIRLAPPRADISLKDTTLRGAPAPAIALVEYADYECPYCQQIVPVVQRLETEYKGKIALAYKDYPLPMHANAQKAAEATRCAESQNRYWDFHDLLFAKKQLDPASLKGYARELKLDVDKFDKCLDSGEKAEAVRLHATEAQSLGLQGTPSFFVNGRAINGALSYEGLRAVIEEELHRGSPASLQTANR